MSTGAISSPVSEPESETRQLRFTYVWIIDDFRRRCEEVKVLRSAAFSGNSSDPIKWVLRVYPKSTKEESQNYVSMYLFLDSGCKTEFRAMFQLSILNTCKEKTNFKPESPRFATITEKGVGYQRFIRRDFLLDAANGLLVGDKLNVCCDVSIYDAVQPPASSLSEDLGHLLASKRFRDVILSADGVEFAAHKGILIARSPVFAVMFGCQTDEMTENVANITDIDSEVLQETLNFVYTGKVSNKQIGAEALLAAADKYGLDRLKVMCEERLRAELSLENAEKTYFIADTYSAETLKARVIDFIKFHSPTLMNSAGWQSMTESNPLVSEVFRDMAAILSPKTKSSKRLYSFKFVIDHFRRKCEAQREMKVSVSDGIDSEVTCFFSVHPKGRADAESEDYLTLSVSLSSSRGYKLTESCVALKVSILNSNGESTNVKNAKGIHADFSPFIRRDFLLNVANALLMGDKLILCCDVCVSNTIKAPRCHLSHDLCQIFDNEDFSDVVVIAKGRKFRLHKGILAARSPGLFSSLDLESRDSAEITDIDPTTVRLMLKFIYTGNVSDSVPGLKNLLVAAKKYGLSRLKAICEERICEQLSIENAADLLVFAFMHKVEQLKPRVIDYIRFHAADVEKTIGWMQVIQPRPHLNRVFRTLAT